MNEGRDIVDFTIDEITPTVAMDAFDDFLVGASFGIALGSLFFC